MADASDALYDRCADAANASAEGYRKLFKQADMISLCSKATSGPLQGVTTVEKLLPLISQLSREKLLILQSSGGENCYALRPRKVAKGVATLTKDERMVYEVIEGAHEEGTWIRTIKNKTGILDNTSLNKLVQRLQTHGLIKNVRNAKAVKQKTYLVSHLMPSDEVTGGSFYDAGELDESLVEEVGNIIIFHVRSQSWGQPDRQKRIKTETQPIDILDDDEQGADARGRKKRKAGNGTVVQVNDIEDLTMSRKHRAHKHGRDPEPDLSWNQLALPAGHAYPTATTIHQFIVATGILRGSKVNSLTVEEIQKVLNILVWDEKLEEINGGYRTVRGVKPKQPGMDDDETEDMESKRGNGLTEAPCGRCPVIDICGTGGLISAANCDYYTNWLKAMDEGVTA